MPDIDIPIMPGRTEVELVINASREISQKESDRLNAKMLFKCLDCDFKTFYVDEMLKHQDNPDKAHKIKRMLGRVRTGPELTIDKINVEPQDDHHNRTV